MQATQIKIGGAVTYYSAVLENGEKLFPKETTIKSEPFRASGGELVCFVEGVSSYVSINHLWPR